MYDKAGKLVEDGINDGSNDYFHPVEEPLKHFNSDIFPWIIWGTGEDDPTKLNDRIEAFSRALGSGLEAARSEPLAKLKVGEGKSEVDPDVRPVAGFAKL